MERLDIKNVAVKGSSMEERKGITPEEYKVIADVCNRLGVDKVLTCGGDRIYDFANQNGEIFKLIPILTNLAFEHLERYHAERVTKALGDVSTLMYQIQFMERELLDVDNFLGYVEEANEDACKKVWDAEFAASKEANKRLNEEITKSRDARRVANVNLFLSDLAATLDEYKSGMINVEDMVERIQEALNDAEGEENNIFAEELAGSE